MRRILLVVTVALVMAAAMVASAVPAFAQDEGAFVTPCSEVFGPEVKGIIVFTPGGTPSTFTCHEGIFG